MLSQTPTAYLLDASGLIEAQRRFYAFDICPGFWASLEHYSGRQIQSIDKVKAELLSGNDYLATWVAKPVPEVIFQETNQPDILAAYARIMTWAQNSTRFMQTAKDGFARGADAWLIAYALAKNVTVVTQEQANATARARILIPNACDEFSVRCVDLFEMLRGLAVQFSWQSPIANAVP